MAIVRDGEEKWIFPYQEEADVMFNTAMLFEFAVIRSQAEPIVRKSATKLQCLLRSLAFVGLFEVCNAHTR